MVLFKLNIQYKIFKSIQQLEALKTLLGSIRAGSDSIYSISFTRYSPCNFTEYAGWSH